MDGKVKNILAVVLMSAATLSLSGQTIEMDWDVSMYGTGATQNSLPFWSVTGKNGIFPNTHGGLLVAGTDVKYGMKNGIAVLAGVKLSGTAVPASMTSVTAAPMLRGIENSAAGKTVPAWSGHVEELYAGISWKMLRLDLGMRDRPADYGGLSLTGGNIVWSGNARNVPGYNLQVDWTEIPGTRGILALKANYADYKTLDDRYVDGAMLHNKSLYAKIRLHRKVYLRLGLEQWSMWGGTSPLYGRQPRSFTDYLRVICGMSGGSGATTSDRINVLGDHRGRELIQVDWYADDFTLTFAHDIPFDDGSGMGMQNFPDGVNTLFFSFNDKNRWVSSILYEFVYTKWQSGPYHDTSDAPPKEGEEWHILGGRDNYFNNGAYKSGWTYYGITAGLPLFTPMPADGDGVTMGVCNNRVVAHHIGIAGKIVRKIPYRFKATYSENYGNYSQTLDIFGKTLRQVSLALEVDIPAFSDKWPLALSVGAYGDVGELYRDSFGLTLRLSYSGQCNFHR